MGLGPCSAVSCTYSPLPIVASSQAPYRSRLAAQPHPGTGRDAPLGAFLSRVHAHEALRSAARGIPHAHIFAPAATRRDDIGTCFRLTHSPRIPLHSPAESTCLTPRGASGRAPQRTGPRSGENKARVGAEHLEEQHPPELHHKNLPPATSRQLHVAGTCRG